MEVKNKQEIVAISKQIHVGTKYPKYIECVAVDGKRIRYKADMVLDQEERNDRS